MRLETNLSGDELTMALAASILEAGIEDSVIDTLGKSKRGGGETATEPEMISLLSQWKTLHRTLLRTLRRNLDLWISAKKMPVPAGFTFPWLWSRPDVVIHNEPLLESVLEAEELTYQHYKTAAGFSNTEYWDRWSPAGIEPPLAPLAELTATAYEKGRQRPIILPRSHQQPASFAAAHAGSYIVGIGSRIANRVLQAGVATLQETYKGTVAHHVSRISPHQSDLWSQLGLSVKEVVSENTWKREMDRVAASELRWAYNVGCVQRYVEDGYDRVYYGVQPTACSNCHRLLLHPDGKPRIFSLRDLLTDISSTAGLNLDRSEQEWKPTALIHPHCQCKILPYED